MLRRYFEAKLRAEIADALAAEKKIVAALRRDTVWARAYVKHAEDIVARIEAALKK